MSIIPVSAVADLNAELDGTTSWSWTNSVAPVYTGGFSTPAGQQQFPSSQAPVTAPATDTSEYSFIVGPTGSQTYTITCKASYPNGSGTATLTFTSSAAPTATISVDQLGMQTWSTTENAGQITVLLDPDLELTFTATNKTNTDGEFALLQIVTSTRRQYKDAANNTWYIQNNIDLTNKGGPNFNGNLIDNGAAGTWNYPYDYAGNEDITDGLDAAAGASIPGPGDDDPLMADSPSEHLVNTIQSITATDSFSTYIVFQSNMMGSVWVAVSQLNWTWTETVSSTNGVWPTPNPMAQPNPGNSNTPAGNLAFPTWVNSITAWQSYYYDNNGNPQNWRT